MIVDQFGSVFVYGRITKLSRSALSAALVNRGGRLVGKAQNAGTVVLARSTLDRCVGAAGQLTLPFEPNPTSTWLSETALDRKLRGDAAESRGSPYALEEVSRLSGLTTETCAALSAYDVIGKGERRFSYADLAAGRQIARLSSDGVAAPAIIRAAWRLQAKGIDLSQVRLVLSPWGELVEHVGGRIARLDGQYALVLDEASDTSADHFAKGVVSEGNHALDDAERWYRLAVKADRRNPLAVYNLGNVLSALGRAAEATIAFQQALAIDAAFAEAAFNLAGLFESRGQVDQAIGLYGDTVAQHPAYAQAVYNLARLLTLSRRFEEALPLWDRFIQLAPTDEDEPNARRGALLCRMELKSGR